MQQVSRKEFSAKLKATREAAFTPRVGEGDTTIALSAPSDRQHDSPSASLRGSVTKPDPFHWKTTTVTEQRGLQGISNIKPSKNVAADPRELSLPIAPAPNRPQQILRSSCDVTKHCQQAVALTGKTVFSKDACTTVKGWSSGQF